MKKQKANNQAIIQELRWRSLGSFDRIDFDIGYYLRTGRITPGAKGRIVFEKAKK